MPRRAASPKKAKAKKSSPKAKSLVSFESHEMPPPKAPIASPAGPSADAANPTGESLASRIARRRLDRMESPRDSYREPERTAYLPPAGQSAGSSSAWHTPTSSSEMQYEQNVPWIDNGGARTVKQEWLEEQMRLTRALNHQYGLGGNEEESEDEIGRASCRERV